MKNNIFLFLALLMIGACDDDNSNSNSKVAEVNATVNSGKWKIVYFFDTDSDETDNFNDYVFEFGSGNTLTAVKGSTTISGSWSVTSDDSGDDDNDDLEDVDFNIAFSSPPDFEELTEDWEIISMTASRIELRHVSGGNGGTDLLTFEKV